tara:strand:- start:8903 stop:9487 length:585 start_codon:yes stop_codon:yes gene_type:complete
MTGAYMQYFQKSKIFLYPLLDIRKGEEFVPVETYIYWDGLYDESDYKYICIYHTERSEKFKTFDIRHLSSHPLFEHNEKGEDKQIYVFDYSQFKHDYEMFVKGSYSKFSIETKKKILTYFGRVGRISGYIESYLDPESHHKTYAKELDVDLKLIESTYELCSPPDLIKETLIEKIPNEFALLRNNSISLNKNNQ